MRRRLLILTQKVDKNDSILGFFHRWLEVLADECDSIVVVCLEKGAVDLPANVQVHSLGKEGGRSRVKYVRKLYSFVLGERRNYDSVFVHMNQEYVLLCGLLWKAMGKRVTMWRNHPKGSILTGIAVMLCDVVFCVSDKSFTARFSKTARMPAGIDTEHFAPRQDAVRTPRTILYAGRISPVKHPDVLIEAAEVLRARSERFRISIVGKASEGAERYYRELRNKARALEEEEVVSFFDPVRQSEMPSLYSSYDIFVNLTDTGSFDKTVIEAMACGAIPLVSNVSMAQILPANLHDRLMFREFDTRDLSVKLSRLLNLEEQNKKQFRGELRETVEHHSLSTLMRRLTPLLFSEYGT